MPREVLRKIYESAIAAVDPYRVVSERAPSIRRFYESGGFSCLQVFGFGKASALMSKAIADGLGDLLDIGIAVTKYGHIQDGGAGEKFLIFEAGHPVPDGNGVIATNKIIQSAVADMKTLTICLISGGGSALLVAPCAGVSFADKREVTNALLACGADIGEINAVRKHLSLVKGGKLARLLHPSKIISLIISDVICNRLDVIASGPTVADKTKYRDALAVLDKYRIKDKIPSSVIRILQDGAAAEMIAREIESDTLREDQTDNIIVADNKMALEAAYAESMRHGFEGKIIRCDQQGEAREVGALLAKEALKIKRNIGAGKRIALLSGGETTVTLRGNGLGGRNTELALAFAGEIAGLGCIHLLSAGTDGTDGPTDAAGAFADGGTIPRTKAMDMDWRDFLDCNDSYNFFAAEGGLFVTGPTGTNVMDIQIVVIEG